LLRGGYEKRLIFYFNTATATTVTSMTATPDMFDDEGNLITFVNERYRRGKYEVGRREPPLRGFKLPGLSDIPGT